MRAWRWQDTCTRETDESCRSCFFPTPETKSARPRTKARQGDVGWPGWRADDRTRKRTNGQGRGTTPARTANEAQRHALTVALYWSGLRRPCRPPENLVAGLRRLPFSFLFFCYSFFSSLWCLVARRVSTPPCPT